MESSIEGSDISSAAAVLGDCFGQGGDFTVAVEELVPGGPSEETVRTEFKVWSVLLAKWSKVFDSMISSGNFSESHRGEVVITDFSAEAVESFLRFMYSGIVKGSLLTVVEVGVLADKYQVEKLEKLCKDAFESNFKPEVACEVFQFADHHHLADLRLRAFETILIHPQESLKVRPSIRTELLKEILSSPFLCIDAQELPGLVRSWKRKADDSLEPILDSALAEAVKKRPAQYAACVLRALGEMYDSTVKESPFLGYWVNVIPSDPSAVKGGRWSKELKGLDMLADIARNCGFASLRKGYMTWMLPHYSVYVLGIEDPCCGFAAGAVVHVYCSQDGLQWHKSLTVGSSELQAAQNPHVRKFSQPPQPAKWFKVQVSSGEIIPRLKIRGILRRD